MRLVSGKKEVWNCSRCSENYTTRIMTISASCVTMTAKSDRKEFLTMLQASRSMQHKAMKPSLTRANGFIWACAQRTGKRKHWCQKLWNHRVLAQHPPVHVRTGGFFMPLWHKRPAQRSHTAKNAHSSRTCHHVPEERSVVPDNPSLVAVTVQRV